MSVSSLQEKRKMSIRAAGLEDIGIKISSWAKTGAGSGGGNVERSGGLRAWAKIGAEVWGSERLESRARGEL